MPLYRLLQNQAFDPEQIEAMSQAFETACLKLELARVDDPLRDAVAKKVIAWAQRGERKPERLCQLVMADIQEAPAA